MDLAKQYNSFADDFSKIKTLVKTATVLIEKFFTVILIF